jgi:2-C-methyl-D-erythritol 4-phosphate cytidylyltransferase/2-C-methyl-D-erythritol 2,4-cyclodiphosphate synthase
VNALAPRDEDLVLIHDGARPFVPAAEVRAVVEAAARNGAAVLVAEISDTVKRVDPDGFVVATVPREHLVRSLTPQVFSAGLLRRSWATTRSSLWTDEAALVESLGGRVATVSGDPRNVKVTKPDDLAALAGLLGGRIRVGQGVDVHPFVPGRPMWLCGVEIPSEVGLEGHSDADAALHAVTDAILGACGRGDIGQYFPPSDPQWRGLSSSIFVERALEIASELGFRVLACDLTVLAERPRIGPHRERMRERLGELLGIAVDNVGLKATTCEGMGFVGRSEGLVAMALVTLEQR